MEAPHARWRCSVSCWHSCSCGPVPVDSRSSAPPAESAARVRRRTPGRPTRRSSTWSGARATPSTSRPTRRCSTSSAASAALRSSCASAAQSESGDRRPSAAHRAASTTSAARRASHEPRHLRASCDTGSLWPGIDMVFRGEGGVLKYEFLVRPGADPRDIRLAYAGADGLAIERWRQPGLGDAAGSLARHAAQELPGEVHGRQPVRRFGVDVRIRARVLRSHPAADHRPGAGLFHVLGGICRRSSVRGRVGLGRQRICHGVHVRRPTFP